ncbi:MAG TPA: protein kinase [Gemmatimonadaceae bacterium]|nr:protein kinase [Gemmatimonadaceae bacterium]
MREPSSLQIESLAERYIIDRELGHGGMATVYLATERKHRRKVAIKMLHADIAASVGAERFLREIGILARLSHPHIVPLIDSGDAEGIPYWVSPFVPGGSLRDRLEREHRLVVDDAVAIAREVAMALDYAHRNGVVHRDVKPENILFADGHAVLADFGVARSTAASDTEVVTEAGTALGTPAYMSPEQASGDTLGAPSDIYSLACVVYEMLAGEPPLRGNNVRATLAKQVTVTPRAIRTLRAEVPAGVERALARALAKAPEHRFATVMAFADALREGAGGDAATWSATMRSVAVLPFVNASPAPENEYLSDGLTDELIAALARVEGLRVASRTSVFALKGKPLDVRAIGTLLGVSEVLEGTVRTSGSHLRVTVQLTSTDDGRLLWSQRYDRMLHDVFALQDEIANTIVDTLRVTSFGSSERPSPRRYTENVKAYSLYLRGRFAWNKRTQEGVTEAIGFFEQAIAEDPAYALAYTGLSDAYALGVDYRSVPVDEGLRHANVYARRAIALDDELAEAHASLAWCLFIYDWKWDDAVREFERAIELDPRYASARQWYAFALAARGELDKALVQGHAAQELDPSSVSARRSLAWLYYYARRYGEARYHLERALAMNPAAEETYRVLGLTLAVAGHAAEAERVLRRAVTMHGTGSYTYGTLGFALAKGGRTDEARHVAEELERLREREYVSPVALATVHLGLGNNSRALDWAERAYAERRGWLNYLAVNPLVDPLRGDPRFDALVTRMRS